MGAEKMKNFPRWPKSQIGRRLPLMRLVRGKLINGKIVITHTNLSGARWWFNKFNTFQSARCGLCGEVFSGGGYITRRKYIKSASLDVLYQPFCPRCFDLLPVVREKGDN